MQRQAIPRGELPWSATTLTHLSMLSALVRAAGALLLSAVVGVAAGARGLPGPRPEARTEVPAPPGQACSRIASTASRSRRLNPEVQGASTSFAPWATSRRSRSAGLVAQPRKWS